jgi:hypothetical protein
MTSRYNRQNITKNAIAKITRVRPLPEIPQMFYRLFKIFRRDPIFPHPARP